jgi:branched-chain amino acid aminotransferase
MSIKVWIDGEYFDKENAKVSVFDHGLLYGDGVFEGIRIYGGKIFKCEEHVKRLFDSAKAIWLKIPMTAQEVTDAMYDALKVNKLTDAYIRLIVTRGAGDLGLDPRKCPRPCVIIIATSITLFPEEFYIKGLDLVTASSPRIAPESLNPRVKSLNYLNNILAKIEGIQAGVIEVLMLNHLGYVSEGSADNVFLVRDGVLYTPSTDAGILEGITRNTVMDLAREAGIKVVEKNISRYEVYTADEMFLTGSAAEVIPAVKVDGRLIGDGKPGKMTKDLRKKFMKLVGRT